MAKYDLNFFQYLEALGRNLRAQPLNLGGIVSSGGGSGGPPGGFIGYLPQTRVAYDIDEFANVGFVSPGAVDASGVVVSATLLDNLNHIRYRIETLETGAVAIYNEDVLVASGVHILDFKGSVDVVDVGGNEVEITISGGAGGGASDFTDLSDTPATYTTASGKYVQVTDTEDGLIFSVTGAVPTDFTDLSDTPSNYSGESGKYVSVKDTEDGLEFTVAASGGSGPDWIINEDHTAECNGADTDFSTDETFVSGSTTVTLNGLIQYPGAANDYEEDGTTGITFATAPLSGDILLISYIKSGTGAATTALSDIYIDASGGDDDTGDGSSGNPYATLAKALSVLPDHLYASVTIHCADGTYTEAIVLKRFRCQGDVWLKITGNTTTPANVKFTGVDNAVIAAIKGYVQAELEGLQLDATATTGLSVTYGAIVYIDRCNITGSLTYGVVSAYHTMIRFWGNIAISAWSDIGISLQRGAVGIYAGPGTLTLTGPGTSGIGIHIYAHSQLVFGGNPANLTITGVQFGFQMGLNALFQHITDTGTITIDNASKPANSAAVQCTDLSSWSTSQTCTFDNFTDAYEANSISYIEASGSRNLTNITNISDATQNSVIYLP